MARNMQLCLLLFVSAGVWHAEAYPAIGGYMPVSNVLEHSQINGEVKAFTDALTGENPDYAKANRIYQDGAGYSCKSPTDARTLRGFATKDLTGESFADAFYANGFSKTFWDEVMQAALAGTGDFTGLSRNKRVTSATKGVLGLVTFYASHELEAAIVKAAKQNTRSDSNSGHAWDEGWAFYYGNNGTDSPWTVAIKRDVDFPDGTKVQTDILPYFIKGLIAVRKDTYDDNAAKLNRDIIYKMWAVTYLRAALKYLSVAEKAYQEKAHAEGYAYYMAIDGWVASKDSAAAKTMREALHIAETSIASGTYCAAKAAMEAAYPAMGIDCTMIGSMEGLISCTTSCSAAKVTLPAGADAVPAVNGSNSADVSCAPSKEKSSETPASETSSDSFQISGAVALGLSVLALVAWQ